MLSTLILAAGVTAQGAVMAPVAHDRVPLVASHHTNHCAWTPSTSQGPVEAARRADAVRPPGHIDSSTKNIRGGGRRVLPDNYIDAQIYRRLAVRDITPAPAASDEAFLRRATLDLAGRLPRPEEVRSFLASSDPDKRIQLIDTLLASPDAVDHWTLWLRDLIGVYDPYTTIKGRNAVWTWLREQVAANRPVNEIVAGTITAAGDTRGPLPSAMPVRWLEAPSTYQDAYDNMAANTAQRFLGLKVLCISCHNGAGHLENVNTWLAERRRRELWELAAFYAHTGIHYFQDEDFRDVWLWVFDVAGGREYVADTDGGDRPPRHGGVIPPVFLLGGGVPEQGENRREALARLVTSNRQFARNLVNRVWQRLMVVGLVEPADDWDFYRLDPDTDSPLGPQTLYPELVEQLALDFERSDYDLRYIVRRIAATEAYAMSGDHPNWDSRWAAYYARRLPRRLTAEEFVDAVVQAGERPARHWISRSDEPVRWARQLPGIWEPNLDAWERELPDEELENLDWDTWGMLQLFGRGNNYDDPRSDDGSISQSLAVMNSSLINRRSFRWDWGSEPNRIQRLIDERASPRRAVEELYLATLSRYPTPAERHEAEPLLARDLASGLEDLFWTLVNTQEFLFRP